MTHSMNGVPTGDSRMLTLHARCKRLRKPLTRCKRLRKLLTVGQQRMQLDNSTRRGVFSPPPGS
ncbi:MAG: hypothetical protein ACRD2A_05000, partial [Vicinamibacterales bacterium]